MLSVFTRELGLVSVYGRSIREARSKLRYHAQELSFARFTLVQGVEYWRLIGAVGMDGMNTKAKPSETEGLAFVTTLVRAATIIRRFVGENLPHQDIFDDLLSLFGQNDLTDIDILLELHILDRLGYISHSPATREEATYLIKRAYHESHL